MSDVLLDFMSLNTQQQQKNVLLNVILDAMSGVISYVIFDVMSDVKSHIMFKSCWCHIIWPVEHAKKNQHMSCWMSYQMTFKWPNVTQFVVLDIKTDSLSYVVLDFMSLNTPQKTQQMSCWMSYKMPCQVSFHMSSCMSCQMLYHISCRKSCRMSYVLLMAIGIPWLLAVFPSSL